MKKIYVNNEGNANKFWSYETTGDTSVHIEWGRLGGSSQDQNKSFSSRASRDKFIDKKVSEKIRKGYEEKTRAEYSKEDDLAKGLGFQYKVQETEWASFHATGKKLRILDDYDSTEYVYVHVHNSWHADKSYHVLLSKNETFMLHGVSKKGKTISFTRKSSTYNSAEIQALRDHLKNLANQVQQAVASFGLTTRVLDIGNAATKTERATVTARVVETVSTSSASEQVVGKFFGLRTRKLDL